MADDEVDQHEGVPDDFDKFKDLTGKLLKVPKTEVDQLRKAQGETKPESQTRSQSG